MILGGAQLVTATLWSLPTTAGFRQFRQCTRQADPMADTVVGVDLAHRDENAGLAVNRWQRAMMRRWRDGDSHRHPAALGARWPHSPSTAPAESGRGHADSDGASLPGR